jgi:ppGpp synthetase/RelA/SpoT-type nucleotidyltranferase
MLTVGYADAAEFLALRLRQSAESCGLDCTIKDHAKEKGYYAHHFYARLPVPIASTSSALEYGQRAVPVEIQITTELQGALREVTHKLYERERLEGGLEAGWKQNFSSGRFRAAYMAHSLRFIEAMIVELRDQVSSPKDAAE